MRIGQGQRIRGGGRGAEIVAALEKLDLAGGPGRVPNISPEIERRTHLENRIIDGVRQTRVEHHQRRAFPRAAGGVDGVDFAIGQNPVVDADLVNKTLEVFTIGGAPADAEIVVAGPRRLAQGTGPIKRIHQRAIQVRLDDAVAIAHGHVRPLIERGHHPRIDPVHVRVAGKRIDDMAVSFTLD